MTHPQGERAAGARRGGWLRRRIGRYVIDAANRRRDAGAWPEAAALYERAARILPARGDLLVQAGNCRKEADAIDAAIALYAGVTSGDDVAEALFQRGDALSRKGDDRAAFAAFADAAERGHAEAAVRIMELQDKVPADRARHVVVNEPLPGFDRPLSANALPARLTVAGRAWLGALDPEHPAAEPPRPDPHVAFEQVGCLTLDNDGRTEALLTGVVAIRARIVSDHAATGADLLLDGAKVAGEAPSPAGRLPSGRWLSVVNIWLDCAALPPRRAGLTLAVEDAAGGTLSASAVVNIVAAADELDLPDSDAFVPSGPAGSDAVASVLARPIQARAAARSPFSGPIREVLAMRVDQLGDVAASLPALQRLRALFGGARLTALVPPPLVAIVAATGICDEVLALTLDYDPATGRRSLSVAEEARARAMLGRRRFDVALDLCPAAETRPLLRLFDARYLVGFDPAMFPFLDFGIALVSRDKANGLGTVSHAAHIVALVEALAAAMAPARPPVRRRADDTALLAGYGLAASRYAIVHAGARHAINRWPVERFAALAGRIAAATGEPVLLFAEDDEVAAPPGVTLAGAMPDDHFDAVVAHARLLVGNDSGPKHLAAVHGVETVAIQVNRLNWREWGQDGRGIVVTRKVPCCGCALIDAALCGKAVACLRTIAADDVYDAMVKHGAVPGAAANASGPTR